MIGGEMVIYVTMEISTRVEIGLIQVFIAFLNVPFLNSLYFIYLVAWLY